MNKPYMKGMPLQDRMSVQTNKTTSCWEWTGSKNKDGYGRTKRNGCRKHLLAHRAAYELRFGTIPDGLLVLHKCDNPSCVNPDHLFLGTVKDNKDDEVRKLRHAYGTRNGNAKLTNEQVLELKSLYTGRHGQQSELARKYGISQTAVWMIVTGRNRACG